MKYKYLIFDFNGTLYDDRKTCLLTINRILKRRNKKELSFEEYAKIFTFPIKNYYLNAGLDLEEEKFEDIAHEWLRNYFSLEESTAKLYDEVIPTLNYLKDKYQIILLSATRQDILEKQLENLKIKDYFNNIVGISDVYANGKIGEAIHLFKEQQIDPKLCLYIGDTLHDKEVSDILGTDLLLVENGHNAKDILTKVSKTIPNLSKLCEIL